MLITDKSYTRALKYLNDNKHDKALPIFKKLVKHYPYKEVALNLGTCYRHFQDWEQAAKYYLLAADPSTPYTDNRFSKVYPKALNNLGLLAYTHEDDEAACILYKAALAEDPVYWDAMWNYNQALFRMYCSNKPVDLKECWITAEARFKRGAVQLRSKKNLIAWDFKTKVPSIVVLTEQGFGDHIQFGRYLKYLENYADKIWIQCADRAKVFYEKYNTCLDPEETDADYGVAFCNLGKILDHIPSGDWLNDKFIRKIPDGKLDIGVTWSGNPHHGNDMHRSSKPGFFKPISNYGKLYTLNPTEANTRGFTTLKSGSWAETIEELSKLDLVISVDTSIVHLCGALGMPCWVLMPAVDSDYRWGDSSMGENNIWYSSVKVIRSGGSWEATIKKVCDKLDDYRNGLRTL